MKEISGGIDPRKKRTARIKQEFENRKEKHKNRLKKKVETGKTYKFLFQKRNRRLLLTQCLPTPLHNQNHDVL